MIFPSITSTGRTGVASRFSIVPDSRSRVIASVVITSVETVRISPISPGTMFSAVSCSGL